MAIVATDNFNRADAANPGANWTKAGGSTFNLRVVSNQLEANNDPSMMVYTARTADQDGEVGITLKTLATTSGQGMGPVRRGSTAANTGYLVISFSTGLMLYKVVADSYAQLGSTFSGTISVNDVISLRATGSSTTVLTVYQNGVSRITFSDNSSPVTSGGDGAFGSIDGAIHPTGDDWYVDNLAVAATSSRRNKQTIHPGRHPDRFGRHLRTRRHAVPPVTTVTGTVAATLGSDTSVASGTTTIVGSANATLGNDTAAASGSVTQPQGSRRGKIPNHPGRGPYNFTRFRKSNRNTAAPLTGVSGTVAVTLGNDTLAASGTTTILGTVAVTLGNDTLSASGTTAIVGTLAKTLGNDTASAVGTTTVIGIVAVTLGNDTLAASGTTKIIGTLAKTLGDDTLAAAGKTTIVGSLVYTLSNDTMSGSGFVGSPPVNSTIQNTMSIYIGIRICLALSLLWRVY